MTVTLEPRPVDYRELMKKVERFVEDLERSDDVAGTLHFAAAAIVAEFRDELGIYGGRLYKRQGKDYVLQGTFADAKPLAPGLRVPRSYPPLELCCIEGTAYLEAHDPSVDRELEERLGVNEFACVEVGDESYILAFNVAPGHNRDDILFSLGILRHSINQKLRQERLQEVLREAHKIQMSILPRRIPEFPPYDLAGRSVPLESVGGDYYDFIPISDKICGVAIADVTGHGLPAALQVRDVYMGLRMGMERDFKIVRTVERLNHIIHGSSLTSRFVSMVYGELEINGNFIYVNAGHPPPFHMTASGEATQLTEGGVVLGPIPDTTYERGFVRFHPGDLLVFYTDGITETMGWPDDADGQTTGRSEEFGLERLIETVRSLQGRTAREIVDAVFARIERFSGGRAARDDRTLVVVFNPPEAE